MTGGFSYGFRIQGGCYSQRRPIDYARAFEAYAHCDERAEPKKEAYLSAFQFSKGFATHLRETGSTRDYRGPCWSCVLWWDIDRDDDVLAALDDTRRLVMHLITRYSSEDALMVFFSGKKGFHVGLPTPLWRPGPSSAFNKVARLFARNRAADSDASIDSTIYDKVRPFRAPNSKHPRTGKYKRFLSVEELLHLKADAILDLASEPAPFLIPSPTRFSDQAEADWKAAGNQVAEKEKILSQAISEPECGASLRQPTLDFIQNGAEEGGRHKRVYAAAANLAEMGASLSLTIGLLEEPALDTGLPPTEVRRAINNGWAIAQAEIAKKCEVLKGAEGGVG